MDSFNPEPEASESNDRAHLYAELFKRGVNVEADPAIETALIAWADSYALLATHLMRAAMR